MTCRVSAFGSYASASVHRLCPGRTSTLVIAAARRPWPGRGPGMPDRLGRAREGHGSGGDQEDGHRGDDEPAAPGEPERGRRRTRDGGLRGRACRGLCGAACC